MKKFLIAALLLLIPCIVFAQSEEGEDIIVGESEITFEAPNYTQIQRETSDPQSHFYYPTLLKRFSEADTTMTIEELRAFYYGYIYQPDFAPYKHFDEEQEIIKILYSNEEQPSTKDFQRVVALADSVIAKKPTEMSIYYYKILGSHYGYGPDDPRTSKSRRQMFMLLDAAYSTGNGTEDYPIHLSTVAHSYLIMKMNNLHTNQQSLVNVHGRWCDLFQIEENEQGVTQIYFDINECFSSLSKMFD